ncbi:MAG: hypothetical protein IKC87_01570 [Clostridia bacterium]|nr:hypothetical protein [Clostridia bacterium]
MKKAEICYPNFTKKAITFSIDDGHAVHDTHFLSIVRPAGILGTFNLCSNRVDKDTAPEIYRGYEIANHCKHHPLAFDDDVTYNIAATVYDPENRDPAYIYPHPTLKGVYYTQRSPERWRLLTDADTYIAFIKECHEELEEIFGEGSVKSFVWPFFEQNSEKVKQYLASTSYYGVRKTGVIKDTTGFNLPEDPMRWCCNATHSCLLEVMESFENYPDDGRLKLFSFGVHSADFESSGRWAELEEFARRYGNRDNEFWYATVGDIFNYNNVVNSLIWENDSVCNPSGRTVYLKVDGERVMLAPSETVRL